MVVDVEDAAGATVALPRAGGVLCSWVRIEQATLLACAVAGRVSLICRGSLSISRPCWGVGLACGIGAVRFVAGGEFTATALLPSMAVAKVLFIVELASQVSSGFSMLATIDFSLATDWSSVILKSSREPGPWSKPRSKNSFALLIIIKQIFYSRLIAIKDSKKGIALMLPKAAGLSISPLVTQNGFPHVTGTLQTQI